ncbi:MAG: enoyl-CoA hydratase-related protein [bacterium]|nr:enoyl-CoA hydratase-related protein [bacterium]
MELVSYTTEGAVGVIELNRPPVNALSTQLVEDIDEAVGHAADPDIRAVVITGRPHFAAGADINLFKDAHHSGTRALEELRIGSVARRLEQLSKPVIAAVFGYALGGGCELAMGADFRYLAEDAKIGQPEIRLGIIPGAGGTQRLPRLVGINRARELIYTGRHIGGEEALAIGLADKVFPADELLAAAISDATRYAAGPSVALSMAKRAINEGWGLPIDEALAVEAAAFDESFASDDAREGVSAFLEKRKARFTGT